MNKRIKLLILLLISSLNFNLILKPLKLVTGGTQGLALIINNFIRINPSIIILIINIIMLILSFIFLEKETIKGTLISVFIYPLFVKLTSYLIIPLDNSLILIILAGLISGITGGYILKLGYSTGGINILVVILKKYFNIKESISNFIINTIIIIIGAFSFGLIKGIYSIIVILINSITIHKIIYK